MCNDNTLITKLSITNYQEVITILRDNVEELDFLDNCIKPPY